MRSWQAFNCRGAYYGIAGLELLNWGQNSLPCDEWVQVPESMRAVREHNLVWEVTTLEMACWMAGKSYSSGSNASPEVLESLVGKKDYNIEMRWLLLDDFDKVPCHEVWGWNRLIWKNKWLKVGWYYFCMRKSLGWMISVQEGYDSSNLESSKIGKDDFSAWA